MLGAHRLRVIDAQILVHTDGSTRTGRYRLVTTLTDPPAVPPRPRPGHAVPPTLGDRNRLSGDEIDDARRSGAARPHPPAGIEQELYALLTTYQVLRLAMADATAHDAATIADRASFTVALYAARDQIVHAAGGVIAGGATIDLIGRIGRAVLADLLPPRRTRVSPRVVKRAISKHRAKGDVDRTNYQAVITIDILDPPD